jgi:hypothetical protein
MVLRLGEGGLPVRPRRHSRVVGPKGLGVEGRGGGHVSRRSKEEEEGRSRSPSRWEENTGRMGRRKKEKGVTHFP